MRTPPSIPVLLAAILPLGMTACGLPTTDSNVKSAAVGLNPDEIGPSPVESGGLIEYTFVEFAGGQMSLAALGLLSFDEAGPDMVGFQPPYGMVNGTGFVFDTPMPSPDAMFGSFAAPSDVKGSCYTNFEPRAYLSNVSDLGNGISFQTEDGSQGFTINRRPFVYPPVVQNVFPYYSELGSWRATPWTHKVPTGAGSQLGDVSDQVFARPNFPFGSTVNIDFPGGMPPAEATFASIPLPLSSAGGDTTMVLPAQPQGFMMSWTGPRFDPKSQSWVEDGGTHSVCLRYTDADASLGIDEDNSTGESGLSLDPTACTTLPAPPDSGELYGQIYTPPWKTQDGLRLQWAPDATTTDTLSFTVRFLGAVDETESYFVNDRVRVDPKTLPEDELDDIQGQWDDLIDDGYVPAGTPLPLGQRPSMACDPESDVEWLFDDAWRQSDGGYIPTLQGDPLHTLVEVTCTLDAAAGEFTLTNEQLSAALGYADQYQAGGAVFYLARTQKKMLDTPAVRDNFGNRKEVPPVTVISKAVQVGRFWYDR